MLSLFSIQKYSNGESIVLYRLIRVAPWIVGKVVQKCTKVLYRNEPGTFYILNETVTVGTDPETFSQSYKINAEDSKTDSHRFE